MGMTIDEIIEELERTKKIILPCDEALDGAIDTIRKYQKIEQIIKSWEDGTLEEKDSVYAFHKIMGVVEDGNDD